MIRKFIFLRLEYTVDKKDVLQKLMKDIQDNGVKLSYKVSESEGWNGK